VLKGWVALTGTPGVGKTAAADRLRLRGVPNVNLGRLAQDYDLVDGFDDARMAAIVDPAKIGPLLRSLHQKGTLLLLDGHWAHDVPGVEAAVVLRLRPRELQARLERRGWPPSKVRENLEAEAMDLILQEAVARLGRRRVYEIDTTGRDLESVATAIYSITKGPAAAARGHAPGGVDWSQDVLAWY
jgi:adenylate kinase